MHLRGLVLLLLSLPGSAHRSIRIDDSHHGAQQQNNMLTNGLEASAVSQETLIPWVLRPGLLRSVYPRAGDLLKRSKQDYRSGMVALQAASGSKEDKLPPKHDEQSSEHANMKSTPSKLKMKRVVARRKESAESQEALIPEGFETGSFRRASPLADALSEGSKQYIGRTVTRAVPWFPSGPPRAKVALHAPSRQDHMPPKEALELTAALQDRGLTRREADSVQQRFQRCTGRRLQPDELTATLEQLDTLELLPGQVTHLLRSHPLPSLQQVEPARNKWCSYKTHIWCSCTDGAEAGADDPSLSLLDAPESEPLPSVVSLDCEFKPLRCAMVDSGGRVRLDCLVTQPLAGTSAPPLPGILECDAPLLRRVELAEMQALLRRLVEEGTVLVAHTPQADLRALQLLDELDGKVVDIAQLGPKTLAAVGLQSVSLKRMASDLLGVDIQSGSTGGGSRGSRRHCAREDAQVTMRLYHVLQDSNEEAGSAASDAPYARLQLALKRKYTMV